MSENDLEESPLESEDNSLEIDLSRKLRLAAKKGDLEKVKHWLSEGALVNSINKKGITALINAAEAGHIEIVRYLLSQNADPHIYTEGKRAWDNALSAAAYYGHCDIIEVLIQSGVSPDETHNTVTPLMQAVIGNQLPAVKLLLQKGANSNSTDEQGMTPLMIASNIGYEDIASVLIEAGALVNAQNKDGKTALMFAVKHKHFAVLKLLSDNGADAEIKDNEGQTALTPKAPKDFSKRARFMGHAADKFLGDSILDKEENKTFRLILSIVLVLFFLGLLVLIVWLRVK